MRVARHNFRETVIKGEIELPYEPAQVHKVISELGATSLNDLMQRCSPNVGGMNLKICYNLAVSLESILVEALGHQAANLTQTPKPSLSARCWQRNPA